ncbi:Importin-5 [Cymbomonas tetramitiformis]|uniref:Importin-5 n=1 Tax=Cymbomonas tetramitiformis TaxID=36881 RepID=A0AAE0CAA2_9CHLO|nr:Importin-5 [Cymbomonas tetramitiformis]
MADQLAVLLDVSNPAAFEGLMRTLTSHDNAVRDPGEAMFNECKKQPDQCTTQLIQVLRSSQHEDARVMCAVLLRKVLTKDVHDDEGNTIWQFLRPETQAGIKGELLKSLLEEPSRSISKKVCDTISEIAAIIYDTTGWPELLPFMFQCIQSQEARHKESALLIFAQLAHCAPHLQPYLGTLHDVLGSSMQPTVVFDVKIAALKATINFILSIENQTDIDRFQDLVPLMLQTLGAALEEDEILAREALEALIELAENNPRFLRAQLAAVLTVMITIAESDKLEDSSRNYAVEFLLTLAQAREKAPGMLRKAPQFVQRLFQALLMFLLDIEDDAAWHTVENDEDEEGMGERYDVGQEGLDRLAIAMGGKTILPLAGQLLPQCLASDDWKMRHAGLIALSQIAEGCAKLIEEQKMLGPISDMCLAKVTDPHPRVRWAAVHAIGQMCTDLGPALQKEQHARILPAILQVMEDHANPRVQAHGSAAVVNFSESCPKEMMMLYCDALITKLIELLQSGKKLVMEGALTALASVADCAQSEFIKYYDTVMPYLKNILMTATEKQHRMLRAKSMECISLVGMAVGKDRFYNDAVEVMDLLMRLQQTEMEDDDPTVSYMLQAWARLCKCLKSAFLPYLPQVMPPLLKSAQLKTDVTVRDVDEVDENEDDEDWETIELGDKRISIRTSVLEEKATACNMLFCYADELKEGFYPYVEEVVQLMVPLLKFYVHEDVRNAAVTALPELLNDAKLALEKGMCAPHHDANWLKAMMDFILVDLCEAVVKEPEVEIVSNMLEALHELIDYGGELLPMDPAKMAQQLTGVAEMFKEILILKKSVQRMEERQARPQEDFDEEELEALNEENEQETDVYDQVRA